MKIRTTERKHNFTKELFDELNIFSFLLTNKLLKVRQT